MRRLRACVVACAWLTLTWIVATCAPAAAATIFGIDQTGVYQIDTVSGTSSEVTIFTPPFNDLVPAAGESLGGTLYFLFGSSNNQAFYSYNTLTPAVQPTLIGNTGTSDYVPRMAVDPNGVIYAMSINNVLYTISPSTGAATTVGTISGVPTGAGGDIAFGPNGVLYIGVLGSLYTAPKTAGAATLVGNISVNTITGLAFDPLGNAYTSDAAGDIYKITGLPGSPTASLFTTVAVGGTLGDLASQPIPVTPAPLLTVSKSDNGPWTANQTGAQYTITVGNSGSAATSGTITVTDTLPNNLTANGNPTGTGWTCTGNGTNAISCTSTTSIAVSGSSTITVPVNVGLGTLGSISNTVLAYGGGDPNHSSSGSAASYTRNTTVLVPALTLTKTDNSPWTIGQSGAKYTITLKNTGTAATSGTITLSDTIPSALTIASGFSQPAGWTCSAVTGSTSFSCTSNSGTIVASGGSQAFTLPVSVGTGTPNSVVNTVSAYGGSDPAHLTSGSAATASDTATLGPSPLLSITKTTDKSSWPLGTNVGHYIITVTNNGTAQTSGAITVNDTLPNNLTVNGTPGGGGFNCTVTGGTQVSCTWSNSNLNPGQSQSFNIQVNVGVGTPSSVTNIASGYGGGDPIHTSSNPATGSNTETINLPSLSVTKTDNGPWTVNQGGAKYVVTVTNNGTGPTTGTITVSDTLPTGLTFQGTPGGGGFTCTTSGSQFTCTTTSALNAGQNSQFNVNVNVTSGTPYSISNTVSAYGGGDPNHSTIGTAATGTDTTTINNVPGLAVTKTDNSGSGGWTIGQTGATYTLTVKNVGTGATSGTITVADTLPSNLTANGNPTGTGWTCSGNGTATISCTSTTAIASGGSSAISVPVNIGAGTPTGTNSITNSVSAYGGGDPVHSTSGTATTGSDSTTIGYASTSWAIGPYQNPNASGSYDGVVASNNQNDFTAANVQRGGNPQVNSSGNGVPLSVTLSASTAPCIAHSFLVLTGGGQPFSVVATAPAGWQVGLYADAACSTLLGGATVGATSTASLGNLDYTGPATTVYSQYTSSGSITVTPFLRYDAVLSSFITGNQSTTNTTHDELFFGFVYLLKTQTILNSTCVGHVGLCPGSTIQYAIAYTNAMPAGYVSSEGSLTPRPFPYAVSFTIDEDGINNGTWGSHGSISVAPSDTTSGTTYTYTKNGVSTANPIGATQFTATIGGSGYGGLAPGASGTVTFVVTIN